MKQRKLLILLLLLIVSILLFKQYNTEMSMLEMDMSEMSTSDAGIELLEVTKKDELLDANSSPLGDTIKGSNYLEELHKCHDEYMKERNELFVSSICDNTFGSDIEKVSEEEEISREELIEYSSDAHMYVVEQEPERFKEFLKKIAEHPELTAAEKEFSISAMRNSNNCPLECLDGYEKYKKEFEEKYPSGIDSENNTFKELVDRHASLAERVRKELITDKNR